MRAHELWRIEPSQLEQAQDEATVAAVQEMERAGTDILTDGEIRRESYSNYFANALDGIDNEHPATSTTRSGKSNLVPRIVGPIRRPHSVEARNVEFLRRLTNKPIKATIPGPFTMSQQAQDDYYGDQEALALALADAVNLELRDMVAAGADIVQLDEPWLTARPDEAKQFAVKAIDRALVGIEATTALHVCHGYGALVGAKPTSYPFLEELEDSCVQQVSIEAAQPRLDLSILERLPSKTLIVGVLDLADTGVEAVPVVRERILQVLDHIEPDRLVLAPDCGMKYLSQTTAFGKLRAMVGAAELVRAELGLM